MIKTNNNAGFIQHHSFNKESGAGFTLIETIVYIGLFLLLIGGGMVGAYGIIEGTDRTSSKTILEQDANFILRKIDWSTNSAKAISFSASQLQVTRYDNSVVTFRLSGSDFQKDGTVLNSSWVTISNLSFQAAPAVGKPGVVATFTATSIDGKLSETFTTTKYLR